MGELTAAEILERARWVYANCRTYQDRGEVVTRIAPLEQGGFVSTERMPFATAFVRPDRLRFEFSEAEVGPEDEWHRALVLWNAEEIRSGWSLGVSAESHDSVHVPLENYAGVSHGVSCTIPTLLIPGSTRGDPLDARDVSLCGRARSGDRECYELRQPNRRGTTTLWIDCATFLLRRVDEVEEYDRAAMQELLEGAPVQPEADVPGFRSASTTTFDPIVDELIDPERFSSPVEWPRAGSSHAKAPASVAIEPIPADSPTALDVLARARAVYAGCRSFRDRGTETKVFVRRSGERRTTISSFSLEFVRPDRFRLESVHHEVGPESEWRRILYLVNEAGARCRFPVAHFLRPWESPELFADVGLQHLVPGLLVPSRPDRDPLPTARSAHLVGTSVIAGRDCFLVAGVIAWGFERTLWIDREHYLVWRCDDVSVFDDAWHAKMRAEAEERLKNPSPDEDPGELRRSVEYFSKPLEPFRTENTQLFTPELDIEIPLEHFATPAEWRDLPVTARPGRGAQPPTV